MNNHSHLQYLLCSVLVAYVGCLQLILIKLTHLLLGDKGSEGPGV